MVKRVRYFSTGLCCALICMTAAAARADIHIDLGGYTLNYAVYADNDEISGPASQDSLHKFEFLRESEIQFKGERTLDNGVTIGAHAAMKLLNEQDDGGINTLTSAARDPNTARDAYLSVSGGFGQFRLGAQDGAAFLLQVAAPSADPNVDGLRVWVQGWDADTWDDGLVNASLGPPGTAVRLDYDNADFGKADRLLYITPKWNGFQFGVSYAPENKQGAVDGAFSGMPLSDRTGKFEHILDLAARWEGDLGPVHLQAAAIHAGAGTEMKAAPGALGSENVGTWDVGVNATYKEVSLGGALMGSNTGTSGPDSDVHIWVAGAAWDRAPWHAGASVYDFRLDKNGFSVGLADDLHLRRFTAGGGFQLAPGVTLSASAALLDVDNGINSAVDPQQMQFLLGSEIWF